MVCFGRWVMERWLVLCMTHQPDDDSLTAHEKQRKLRLLSIFEFFAILAQTSFTIVDAFTDFKEVIVDIPMLVIFSGTVISIRQGRLVLATLVIFLSIIVDMDSALAVIAHQHALSIVWLWVPMTAVVVIGGLLLPFWGPTLLCACCMLSLIVATLSKERDLAAFHDSDLMSFIFYGCITMAGLAAISTLYAQTMDKAVREADRAYELDLAHKELALSHDELERAYQQLERLATVDPITGLLNHRAFSEHLRRLVRQGATLSLVFADLDHFKRINDTWGHQIGDAALAHVARTLESCARRSSDVVARYGGEEFVLLLPEMEAADALIFAQSLCRTVAGTPFHFDDEDVSLTVSLGIATVPEHAGTADDLIAAADAAMYRAKHEGRNRACVADRRKLAA
jgi:diguanylate cyclase (GGDEF)-like protein